MKKFVSEGILGLLNFLDLNVYVNYVKEKQTIIRRLCANRTLDVLELIHTDIYGSLTSTSWNG